MAPENGIEWTSFQVFPVIRMDPPLHFSPLFHGNFQLMLEKKTRMNLDSGGDPMPLSEEFVDVDTHTVLIDQHSEVRI